MNFTGIIVGIITFFLIGIFHPIVMKGEYYFGAKIWPIFLLIGAVALGISLFTEDKTISSILAVFGITCLWSIKELFDQEKRVAKGWYPKNPKRK